MPVYRNPQFYFKEGFCWNNVLNPSARLLKARLKNATINDVGSMSLMSVCDLPNIYFVALLNSNIMFDYYREFINCTVNIQINDLRQLPVVIPTSNEIASIVQLFKKILVQKLDADEHAPASLNELENNIDRLIFSIYLIN